MFKHFSLRLFGVLFLLGGDCGFQGPEFWVSGW